MRTESSSRHQFLTVFLPIALSLLGAVALTAWFSLRIENERNHEMLIRTEERHLEIYTEVITRQINMAVGDIRVLARSGALAGFLFDEDEESQRQLAGEFIALAEVTGLYDQIRLLDATGMERIRIDYDGRAASTVRNEDLQQKSDRYYFVESIGLPRDTAYLSDIDLNIEHGVIETPYTPMLRIAIPLYGPGKTEVGGILVLNALASRLFDELAHASASNSGELMLLNKEGYWLYAEDETLRWGFMLAGRAESVFSNYFPVVWEQMQQASQTSTVTRDGIFVVNRIDSREHLRNSTIASVNGVDCVGPSWWIVSRVTREAVAAYGRERTARLLFLLAIVAVAATVISVFLARSIVRNKNYRTALEAAALYDPLTQLPNRLLFVDRFAVHRANAIRTGTMITVIFLDLDWFKEVNDSYGHDAGDELLIEVGRRLVDGLRNTDTVARLGGDEFVVLLADCATRDCAGKTAEKIRESLTKPFDLAKGTVQIGASLGIYVADPSESLEFETVLERADSAMYRVKRSGKGAIAFCGSES